MGLIRDLLTSTRAHGSGNLVGPAAAVALLVHAPWWYVGLMALMGSLVYQGGCGENSIYDVERDRQDPLRTQLPLVVGRVTVRQLWAFALFCTLVPYAVFVSVAWYRGSEALALLVVVILAIAWGLSHAYNRYGKTSSRAVAAVLFAFATTIPILAVGVAWTGTMTPVLWWLGAAWTLGLLYVTVSGDWKDLDSAVKQGERNLVTDCGGTLLHNPFHVMGKIVDARGRVIDAGTPFQFHPGRYGYLLAANAFLCVIVDLFFAHWLNGWIWGAVVGTIAAAAYLWNYREIMRPDWEKSRATYVAAMGTVFSIVGPFFVLTWAIGWYWMPVLIFGPILLHLGLLKAGVGKEWSNSILSNRRMVKR